MVNGLMDGEWIGNRCIMNSFKVTEGAGLSG